jgi:peptidoglycan hydrolase-like protein with peptidoglycan-binding domain
MRYLSHDASKDLTASELKAMNNAGIKVGLVWETTADRMLGGYSAGNSDGASAKSAADALGMAGIPIYFACDWDASESQQAAINSYLDGAAAVVGRDRTGIYGGYWPLKRALDAGKAKWAWQTYAWSGGNKDDRRNLYQYHNGVTVCGQSSDWNEQHQSDAGLWPRGTAPPQPKPPATAPAFPYPSTDYLGTTRSDPHCHSGYYAVDQPNVKKWQQQMIARGWYLGSMGADGIYGNNSQTVCISFQTEKGLTVDGLVGPQTWKATWEAPVT